MSLEKASIAWSAKQLKGMVMNGKINYDHIVQRSYVWEKARKSALIESMIIGYPIPPVFAKRTDDGSGKRGSSIYSIMDGKQRLSTVKEYLNDEFVLTDLEPITYMDDETGEERKQDISGMKFSELPDALRNHLETITFNVTYFDNLTKEEERELFKRLNAGKPLSTKSRLLASCKDIEGLLDIGSHKLFDEMMTEKSRDNKNQVAIVMKIWCMMYQDVENMSFESKVFNPMLEKTEITEAEKLAMIEVFNLIVDTHGALIERKKKKVAKKLYTETHMVSLVPYFKKSIEDGVDTEMMVDWLIEFFDAKDTASVSEEYNAACTGGSAKNTNIVARHDALADSYVEFFKFDDECDGCEDDDADADEDEINEVIEDCESDDETDEIEADVEDEGDEDDDFEYPELYKSVMDDILGEATHYDD